MTRERLDNDEGKTRERLDNDDGKTRERLDNDEGKTRERTSCSRALDFLSPYWSPNNVEFSRQATAHEF